MDRWLLSFFIGAIFSLFSPTVPVLFYKTLIAILLLMFLCVPLWRTALAFVLGALWVLFSGHQVEHGWQRNNLLPQDVWGKEQKLNIRITSIPINASRSTAELSRIEQNMLCSVEKPPVVVKQNYFYGTIIQFNEQTLRYPVNVRLSISPHTLQCHPSIFQQGNLVRLTAKLKPSYHFANQGTFNFKSWLLSKKIVTTGYVNIKREFSVIEHTASLRQQWFQTFNQMITDEPLKAIILALTFGERAYFNSAIWEVLQQTGTQHLIAISGLHIGLVFTFAYLLLRVVMQLFSLVGHLMAKANVSHVSRYAVSLNVQPLILMLSTAIAIFYGYLANYSIPTSRALMMLGIIILMRTLSLHLSFTRLILLSLFLLIIVEPLSLLTASFWLTFYAVIVIVFTLWRFQSKPHQAPFKNSIQAFFHKVKVYWLVLIKIQLAISLLMLPMNLITFGQFSWLAIVANLIAVPVVSILIMPILLCVMLALPLNYAIASFFVDIAIIILTPMWQFLTDLSQYPNAFIELTLNQQTFMIVIILCGIALLLSPFDYKTMLMQFKNCRKIYLLPLMLLVASAAFVEGEEKAWQMHVLDVGQGLAVVIIKNHRAIVYDTGAHYRSGFNFADTVIMPFLKRKNIDEIDYLFISHDDNDHAGGLSQLIENFPINHLIFNEGKELNNKGLLQPTSTSRQGCIAGENWSWQGLDIIALHPDKTVGKANNDSCVLLIKGTEHRVLLTGDISKKVETKLINQSQMKALDVDVLIAPHHGSKTSSSKAFIQWASPKYVVFSAGFMNRWRMPNAEVVARFNQAGVKHFTTAISGTVTVDFYDRGLEITQHRLDIVPYWFAN